jgi:phosphoribosylaminoimidazole carboxylase PurE protein
MSNKVRVGILMGSDSDLGVMEEAEKRLQHFGIAYEVRILSAHRAPRQTLEYAASARERGIGVIIVGAGAAAHLGGMVAANTTIPVIGVPIDSSSLQGADALLSTVQMPAGIPVATMAIGKAGAANAAIFAAQILSLGDRGLTEALTRFKEELALGVAEKDKKLQEDRQNRKPSH